MTETAAPATYLTQAAHDRLQAELDHLTGPARTEIAKKIDAARQEGDLRENGGYHAAREEQGKMEARIRQLQQLLDTAIIGETPPDDGIVEPGLGGMPAHHLRLVGIEPAAQRYDGRLSHLRCSGDPILKLRPRSPWIARKRGMPERASYNEGW